MHSGIKFKSTYGKTTQRSPFQELFDVFKELLLISAGDVAYTLQWMHEIDRRHGLTKPDYGMADFIEDLEKNKFISRSSPELPITPSSKMEKLLRKDAFKDIFGQVKKSFRGQHNSKSSGIGDEWSGDIRQFEFGDNYQYIDAQETLKSVHKRNGPDDLIWSEEDIYIHDKIQQSQCSTVLMIDISHSMILYGEDRITPAKKVGLALAEFITSQYPKDSLDIIAFGDDAKQITIKDLPYLEVGPFHTNTVAGLELSIELLKKKKNPNKQIMMITDGKPTCVKKGKEYYKNSFGLDRQIVNRTIGLGLKCRKLGIDVSTFMVASDPYLVQFVEEFSYACAGKAFYTQLDGLGEEILIRYINNRRKK